MIEHKPVMLHEVIAGLAIKSEGFYLDATFGRGGHSRALLEKLNPHGRLWVIDKDPEAILAALELQQTDARVTVWHGSFASLKTMDNWSQLVGKFDGVLLDLGVSSPQLDNTARGFSFMRDGPLDMRMNNRDGQTAALWLNSVSEQNLTAALKEYGEERFARRIARAIISARQEKPLTTTLELAGIVQKANPAWEKNKHPATRSFQAIRMAVNNELQELTEGLNIALELLSPQGKLVVISFHSLEDRIVKRFIQKQALGDDYPPHFPIPSHALNPRLKKIGKAVFPSDDEIAMNPRARSAVLRIAEKMP